jgi:hypothetical protein
VIAARSTSEVEGDPGAGVEERKIVAWLWNSRKSLASAIARPTAIFPTAGGPNTNNSVMRPGWPSGSGRRERFARRCAANRAAVIEAWLLLRAGLDA